MKRPALFEAGLFCLSRVFGEKGRFFVLIRGLVFVGQKVPF